MVDLFAGTGAFSFAFEKSGKVKVVMANDYIEDSKKIYKLNYDSLFLLKDLNKVTMEEIPEHDILCGGFPCQPFSIAGEKKGFDDKRSNVFWKIIEILKTKKPSMLVLENVKNLTTHDKGNTFKVIKENITKLGYHLKFKVLNTCKLTELPQNRERIYIVGFLDKKKADAFTFDFKEVKNRKISDFLEKKVPTKYYYTKRFNVYDKIKESVTKSIKENVLYQYRRHYVRENMSNVCPTLTANMGGGGHNVPLLKDSKGIRKLTPRECFSLQGFPTTYKLPELCDSRLYKLAGNAVSVPIVELIVRKLF